MVVRSTFHDLIRVAKPEIRTTFQMLLQTGTVVADPAERYAHAVEICMGWLAGKFPELPAGAMTGEPFDVRDLPGRFAGALRIPERGLWAARLERPDAALGGLGESVPARTWITDLSVHQDGDQVWVAARDICATDPRPDGFPEVPYYRPQFVRRLAKELGLTEIRPLAETPWRLESEGDLAELEALLTDPRRQRPVYLLPELPAEQAVALGRPYAIDPETLARRAVVTAHVCVLPGPLVSRWMKRVGRWWSAFNGSLRMYRPGLDFAEDPAHQHPFYAPERIAGWQYQGLQGEEAFILFLEQQACRATGDFTPQWGNTRLWPEAVQLRAELRRATAATSAVHGDELLAAADEEIKAVHGRVRQLELDAESWSNDALEAQREARATAEENFQLRSRIELLQGELEKRKESVILEIPRPADWEELPDWVERTLNDRLILHPRAINRLRKAVYEDFPLVCVALELLAGPYRDSKLAVEGTFKLFESRLQELGLDYTRSISEQKASKFGDTYFLRYPLGNPNAPRHFIEWHLKKGSDMNPVHTLRIDFLWHKESRQIIVANLPEHLQLEGSN